MAQTIKKQVKFSKGEITLPLKERTDLAILNSSASYLNNYIATIYGGIKTRNGTIEIDSILSSLVSEDATYTTSIGGDESYLGDSSNTFLSDSLDLETTELHLDLTDTEVYEVITLKNIKLGFSSAVIELTISGGVITAANVVSGGIGYKTLSLTVDGDGSGASLSYTLSDEGAISTVTVDSGGSGYTTASVIITETDTWTDSQTLEISSNNVDWTEVSTFDIDRNQKTLSFSISSAYRYIRLSRDGSSITARLEMLYFLAYNNVAAQNRVRMLPFVFNDDQKYLLMLTDETIRVYQDDQLIETIPASGIKDDYFKRLKFTQAEDTMVLTHPSMRTKRIQRGVSESGTTFIPQFSSGETTKDGYSISADSDNPYRVVDQDLATNSNLGEYYTETADKGDGIPTTYDYTLSNDFIIDFPSEKAVTKVTFNASDVSEINIYTKDVSSLYTLKDTRTFLIDQEDYTTENSTTTFTLDESCYGLKIETTGVKINTDLLDGRDIASQKWKSEWYPVKMFDLRAFETLSTLFSVSDFPLENIPYYSFSDPIKTDKTVGITPSASEGGVEITADSDTFTEDSVGQYINTSLGSKFKITSYITAKKVSGYTIIPFLNTNKITEWEYETGYEPVWSEDRGWPNSCLFYQQRLWFGGSKGRPQTVWASRTNSYSDFENIGNYDNDSIEAPIAARENNEIVNILDNRGLQIFTSAEEFIANEASLTPANIFITKTTSDGSLSRAEPIIVGGTTIFIEKNGKSLTSFVYNEVEANYKTASISLFSSHLIKSPLRLAIDYNSDRDTGNYMYMAKEDGELLISCILLDQEINSFTRFNTNGLIKDVLVLKSDTYLLVERNNTIYLEKITTVKTDGTLIKSASTTISGLEKWEGMTVRAYTSDNDGTFTVSSGEITLDWTPDELVYVGEDIECSGESNNIYISNETTSQYKRIAKATLTTVDTNAITFNGQEKTSENDIFDFYSVSRYERENKFTFSSTFDQVEILSVLLHINYGGA